MLLVTMVSGRASAAAPHFLAFGAEADAPVGFVEMCAREADQCTPSGPHPSPPDPTLTTAAILDAPFQKPDVPLAGEMPWTEPVLENAATCSTWVSCTRDPWRARALPSVAGADRPVDVAFQSKDEGCLSKGTEGLWGSIWCRSARMPALPQPDGDDGSAPSETLVADVRQEAEPGARSSEWRLVSGINRTVNSTVKQVTDQVRFGVDERWERPSGSRPEGDCEDIALEKRQRLIDAGFPAGRLFLAVVFSQREGLHTLLVVRLTDGDYVLDNLSPFVVRWSNTPYSWLRLQMPGKPRVWRRAASS